MTNRKSAVITGASGGIGLDLAHLFARDGWDLFLVARSEDKLRSIAAEIERAHSVKATVIAVDLARPEAPETVLAAVGTAVLVPGLVFAGPIAIALTAAGAVGLAGGLIGALKDWGIPQDRVNEYEAAVRDGAILVGVKARSDEDAQQLEQKWRAEGGR